MSDREGKVLWWEIEQLLPWEVHHPFSLSRSIWGCCQHLVCLVLFSKVDSPYLLGSGNTLLRNLAASLNLHFHTVVTNLLTPCATFHGRQLRLTQGHSSPWFWRITLLESQSSSCLRSCSLHLTSYSWRFITAVQVHFKELSTSLTVPVWGIWPIKWQWNLICCNFRMERLFQTLC